MLTGIFMLANITSPIVTATTGLPQYWNIVIGGLLILLSLMEVLVATQKWNRDINCSFNIATTPLILSFIGVVILKIINFSDSGFLNMLFQPAV